MIQIGACRHLATATFTSHVYKLPASQSIHLGCRRQLVVEIQVCFYWPDPAILLTMDQQGANNQTQNAAINSGNNIPSNYQPYMKNEDYRKFQQLASQKRPITMNHLSSVKSFKVNNEREYQMTMLLCHKLNEEMTKYRLDRTPQHLLAKLEKSPGDIDGFPTH